MIFSVWAALLSRRLSSELSRGAALHRFSCATVGVSHPLGCEMRGLTQFGLERCFEFLKLIATGESRCYRQPEENHRVRGVAGLDKVSDGE